MWEVAFPGLEMDGGEEKKLMKLVKRDGITKQPSLLCHAAKSLGSRLGGNPPRSIESFAKGSDARKEVRGAELTAHITNQLWKLLENEDEETKEEYDLDFWYTALYLTEPAGLGQLTKKRISRAHYREDDGFTGGEIPNQILTGLDDVFPLPSRISNDAKAMTIIVHQSKEFWKYKEALVKKGFLDSSRAFGGYRFGISPSRSSRYIAHLKMDKSGKLEQDADYKVANGKWIRTSNKRECAPALRAPVCMFIGKEVVRGSGSAKTCLKGEGMRTARNGERFFERGMSIFLYTRGIHLYVAKVRGDDVTVHYKAEEASLQLGADGSLKLGENGKSTTHWCATSDKLFPIEVPAFYRHGEVCNGVPDAPLCQYSGKKLVDPSPTDYACLNPGTELVVEDRYNGMRHGKVSSPRVDPNGKWVVEADFESPVELTLSKIKDLPFPSPVDPNRPCSTCKPQQVTLYSMNDGSLASRNRDPDMDDKHFTAVDAWCINQEGATVEDRMRQQEPAVSKQEVNAQKPLEPSTTDMDSDMESESCEECPGLCASACDFDENDPIGASDSSICLKTGRSGSTIFMFRENILFQVGSLSDDGKSGQSPGAGYPLDTAESQNRAARKNTFKRDEDGNLKFSLMSDEGEDDSWIFETRDSEDWCATNRKLDPYHVPTQYLQDPGDCGDMPKAPLCQYLGQQFQGASLSDFTCLKEGEELVFYDPDRGLRNAPVKKCERASDEAWNVEIGPIQLQVRQKEEDTMLHALYDPKLDKELQVWCMKWVLSH
eukprot:gnl/TRDRNA2_/TRDRNA2_109893_c0_seq1.p1 gnl/TRDRNA2_/TRDRNA2_109893_c0~~gnl/TRDRNA2_/TRDRNA2_109893_c0_seq1.p1  ORF type:complete len:806 (-),score=107.84 gnl/TRDRNA2_/TRDRNA2_109893_c0_seq1:73-2391(-)